MAIDFIVGDMVNIDNGYGVLSGEVVSIQDPLFPEDEDEIGRKKVRIQLADNDQFIEYFKTEDEFGFITKVV